MLRTCARRGVVGGTALVVGLAGLTIGQGAASASAPLPASQAGPVAIWGPGDTADSLAAPSLTSDQASEAFTKVVANGVESAIGLTADGTVEQIGTNYYGPRFSTLAIPADLAGKTVVDIAGDSSHGSGMAVTNTGDVYAWSTGYEGWAASLPTPSGLEDTLQGSTAVAISGDGTLGAVVKQDGSVHVWGTTPGGDFGQKTPPTDLTGASAVFFGGDVASVFALKSDGTLVPWGDDTAGQTDLPALTTDASDDVDVTDVASVGGSEVALLSDGSLVAWGAQTTSGEANEPPATLDGKDVVALASNGAVYFAIDSAGAVYEWGQGASTTDPAFAQLPDGVDPANITGLSANSYFATAIQATLGYVAKPTISGTTTVGQTLTAAPATFTATPDSTTGQWLADGTPIAEATGTTYTLTAAEVGKRITYSETATRGTESATATSDPTAAVVAASTGGGNTITPPADHHQQLAQDQAQLQKAQTKLKKAKKALKKAKKAHNAKKAKKLKKKVKKLKKLVKADKKLVQADQ